MNYAIPKSFKIGTTNYEVWQPLYLPKEGRGLFSVRVGAHEGTVKVAQARQIDNAWYTGRERNATFWHEAVHAILYEMHSPLYRDEDFVDEFSVFLCQLLNSAKFK